MELIDKIMNSKKLPYIQLVDLFTPYLKRYDLKAEKEVTIFIDYFDLLNQLYNGENLDEISSIKYSDRLTIASHVINMISHYRHFFFSRLGIYTNFYIYASFKKDDDILAFNPEYKKEFYTKRLNLKDQTYGVMNSISLNTLKIVRTFLSYVPHAYLINTMNKDYSVLPYYIIHNKDNPNNLLNIIISNEEVYYQDTLDDKTIILDNRVQRSKIITKENLYDILLDKSKTVNPEELTILPELYTAIEPLVANKKIGLKSVKRMGYAKAIKYIQNKVNNNEISNIEYSNPDTVLECLNDLNNEEKEIYKMNMKSINHKYLSSIYDYSPIVESQIVDRFDPEGIRKTNEIYFAKNPVLLDFLFDGEEYVMK